MAIIEREFTYKGRIKVSKEDFELAVAGKKTGTIRLGRLSVARRMTDLSDGTRSVPVEILGVDNTRVYSEMTADDARLDGLDSLEALDRDLRRYYRAIDPAQPMTVIEFRLVGDPS